MSKKTDGKENEKKEKAKWELIRLADEPLYDAFICSVDSLFTVPLFSL